jgi:hypothetical protein
MTTQAPEQNKKERSTPEKSGDKFITPLTLDPNKYRSYLEEFDLTEEQENELLAILWRILSTMVDIGFGLDSVQMLFPAMIENAGVDLADSVKQEDAEKGDCDALNHAHKGGDLLPRLIETPAKGRAGAGFPGHALTGVCKLRRTGSYRGLSGQRNRQADRAPRHAGNAGVLTQISQRKSRCHHR